MFSWYSELTAPKRKAFWAAYGGWGMDAMDVQLFSFLIPSLIAAWGISRADIGYLGTAALISSAIGGWIGGVLSDRLGRVRIMQITILWYSVFTFLSGFTTSFEQLFVVRVLQGIGFGAEWATGAVLIGEIVSPMHRGKTVGCLGSAYAVGWGSAALLAFAILSWFPADIAWRVVFWVGLLPALLVIFVRRFVDEPEIFQRVQNVARSSGANIRAGLIFKPPLLRRTIFACILAIGLQGGVVTILTWLPAFLKAERHLSVSASSGYIAVVTTGAFFGYIANGYASDFWGRRRTFLVFCAMCLLILVAYTYLRLGDSSMLLLGFPLGFFALGNFGSLAPFLTELFPTEVRAAGQGFSNSIGRGMGGLFVGATGLLGEKIPLGEAIGILAVAGYALAAIAVMLLPETRGAVLTSVVLDDPLFESPPHGSHLGRLEAT